MRIPFFSLAHRINNNSLQNIQENKSIKISEFYSLNDLFYQEQEKKITQKELDDKEIKKVLKLSDDEQRKYYMNLSSVRYMTQDEDGKFKPGQSQQRQIALHSNWNASNVDPQDMLKHRELLERQYFSGPYWENKHKPKSIDEQLLDYNPAKEYEEELKTAEYVDLEEQQGEFVEAKM